MKMTKRYILILLLLAFIFIPTQSAAAKGLLDGQVIFGSSYTLKSGDTLDGDLVVIGGIVTIEVDAKVEGNVVLIGGNLTVDGKIEGDTVVIGGIASLGEEAIIEGDLVTVGGSLQRDPGARVEGEVVSNIPAPLIHIPSVPSVPAVPHLDWKFNALWGPVKMFFNSVAVAAIAMLVVMFMQSQTARVAHAIVSQPLVAGGIGLLALVLAPFVLVLMAATIILIPIAFVVLILLLLAWLLGVIAMGMEVGQRFVKLINREWASVLSTGFGTFLLMLVLGTVNFIPCVGWLISFLVGLAGAGGVMLTLFGTRSYPPLSTIDPTAHVESGAGG